MEPAPPPQLAHRDTEAMLGYVLPVLFALSLMRCRNVEIRTVEPNAEASRAHRRRHHHRLVRYQVLDIEPMRRILNQAGATDPQAGGLRQALTICRGHFKTFTRTRRCSASTRASSGGHGCPRKSIGPDRRPSGPGLAVTAGTAVMSAKAAT